MSNVGSAHLGSLLLQDVAHTTVCRHEAECGAAFAASAMCWHADLASQIVEASAESDMTVLSHAIRTDATNSGVWQNSKLHSLELNTACTFDHSSVACSQGLLQHTLARS
eukprot:6929341-Alexandrium_andersonii.AAC.1